MKAKILIVDDEENIRFTLERFLLAEGYETSTAENYEQALAILDRADIDLILTDIVLNGKTGVDILREVKARKLECSVVMFTGAPTHETAAKAVRLGAFDYIPKPIRQETLLRVTASALSHKALTEEKERYRQNLEAIFKSVKDGIITVDQELSVVEMNAAAGRLCGVARKEAIGKAFDALALDCGGRCAEFLKETVNVRTSAEIKRHECRCKQRPAQIVNLITHPLLNSNGLFTGMVLVIRDETRLVGLEQSLNERRQFHGLIGKDKKMQEIYALTEQLGDVQTTVLIAGETGTGKELLAEALHVKGARKSEPFVKVNCAALPEDLLESELFGHVKGAFTGAVRDKIGRFQRAHGGTIFLDEIGEISIKMQLRLLRVLQEMEFERVGDSTPIKVDVRVVAATNKDLHAEVKRGSFRKDLYYRLKVVELELPPLRNKRADIPLLVDHFIEKFCQKFGKKIKAVSEDVLNIFMDYSWPGNVRELEHALEHAFIRCSRDTIMVDHLPPELRLVGFKSSADEYSEVILRALEKTRWNKTEAARLLGISRQTLYRKMKKGNLSATFDRITPVRSSGPTGQAG